MFSRIIALNPQNELFSESDADKLNSNSAECVETIYLDSENYLHNLNKRNIIIISNGNKSMGI